MSPTIENISLTAISPYWSRLPTELQWEIIEYAIPNIFTTDDPYTWANVAGSLLSMSPGLTQRLLLPLKKIHRAMHWEMEKLWPAAQANGPDFCAKSAKRAYLAHTDAAVFKIFEIIGADEDWADRELTGYTFFVAKYNIDQVAA